VGPTASGKSDFSYQLIRNFGGCIVNCDSLQVYEGLDIGSAKPSASELSGAPNYLFSEVKKGEEFTANHRTLPLCFCGWKWFLYTGFGERYV